MVFLIILLSLVIIALVCSVIAATVLFKMAICKGKGNAIMKDLSTYLGDEYRDIIKEGRTKAENTDFEWVQIKSRDGLNLYGRFLPAKNAKRTIMLVHGYRSVGTSDFGCALDFYRGLGMNIFIPDQRAHGKSEGKYICFGALERFDIAAWINYLAERLGEDHEIFIDGISMGCSTVLMASGLGLRDNVKGIMADCGYTSPYDIFAHILKNTYKLPKFPIIYIAGVMCKYIAKFDMRTSTLDAMKTNKIPILFVHGDKDDFVPHEMSKQNYEACIAEKELVIVKGAKHGMSYLVDTETCQRKIVEFISKYSKNI